MNLRTKADSYSSGPEQKMNSITNAHCYAVCPTCIKPNVAGFALNFSELIFINVFVAQNLAEKMYKIALKNLSPKPCVKKYSDKEFIVHGRPKRIELIWQLSNKIFSYDHFQKISN